MADTVESGEPYHMFDCTNQNVRRGFIRKVYAILTLQLAITIGVMCPIIYVEEVNIYVYYNLWPIWTILAVTFVILIALSCCVELRRTFPANIICLLLFTVCEGVLLGIIANTFDTVAVMIAVGITIILIIGLTIFAIQTKIDFTMMSGLLFSLLLGLVIFAICGGIFYYRITEIVYASIAAILFSMYIVYDTQMILGKKHKYAFSEEEYIFAALNLYIDVVQLFLMLLLLLRGKK